MASTGVKVDDAIVNEFNDLKLGRVEAKYVIYKIDGGKIVTDVLGPKGSSFDSFRDCLPTDDCRYAVYDCDYTSSDGRPSNKLVSIAWYDEFEKLNNFLTIFY
jgi:cofilin